jgi:hypothetical protein
VAYNHKEAFCLLKYASNDGQIVEWIWNSRDGVTPFGVMSRCGTKELRHVQWRFDVRIVNYEPLPGERIFVDATEELLRPKAEEIIARHHPTVGGEERASLIRNTIRSWLPREGVPFVKLVGGLYAEPSTPLGQAIADARAKNQEAGGSLRKGDG